MSRVRRPSATNDLILRLDARYPQDPGACLLIVPHLLLQSTQPLAPRDAAAVAEAERRLQLLMPTCLAWSELLPANDGKSRCCLLAVGTKAGCVWIWAFQPQPPRLRPDKAAESAALRLVRTHP